MAWTRIKRWADYLNKTNSEDSAARFFGKSTLEADGFPVPKRILIAEDETSVRNAIGLRNRGSQDDYNYPEADKR